MNPVPDLNKTTPTAATGQTVLALPREVCESNDFNMLPKSLGKASLIDLHIVSAGSPKPIPLKSERQQQVQIGEAQPDTDIR